MVLLPGYGRFWDILVMLTLLISCQNNWTTYVEVRRLVHVNPETVNIYTFLVEESLELAVPVTLGVFIEPIWEDGRPGPNSTL